MAWSDVVSTATTLVMSQTRAAKLRSQISYCSDLINKLDRETEIYRSAQQHLEIMIAQLVILERKQLINSIGDREIGGRTILLMAGAAAVSGGASWASFGYEESRWWTVAGYGFLTLCIGLSLIVALFVMIWIKMISMIASGGFPAVQEAATQAALQQMNAITDEPKSGDQET